jgi:hypothetical protein
MHLFLSLSLNEILVFVPLMSDGFSTHTIAATREWIFDSNFPNCLQYNRESLDMCCGNNASFVRVLYGYKFWFKPKRLRKRQRKKQKTEHTSTV